MKRKHILRSKTIWGVLITLAPVLGPLVGVSADEAVLVTQTVDNLIQVFGAALAVFGRVVSKDKLYA